MLRQREPRLRIQKILSAAKGQECTIGHPVHCNGNRETTVAAHSNWHKGVGMKSDDLAVAFACSGCHDWLDRTREAERMSMWLRGHLKTLRLLWEMEVIR